MSHKDLQLTLLRYHTLCNMDGIISGETWVNIYTQQRGNWDRPTYGHHQRKWWFLLGLFTKLWWRVNSGAERTPSCIAKITPIWIIAHKSWKLVAHYITCDSSTGWTGPFFRQLGLSEPLPDTWLVSASSMAPISHLARLCLIQSALLAWESPKQISLSEDVCLSEARLLLDPIYHDILPPQGPRNSGQVAMDWHFRDHDTD